MRQTYFKKLNYTSANEDTTLELGLVPDSISHLMYVAGSGGRVLPLLAKQPKQVTCVDISQEQLYLTELRIESLRALSHSEFLSFWGYPPFPAEPEQRKHFFKKIKLTLDSRLFFLKLFKSVDWESILYLGKWERTMAKLSAVNRRLTGLRGIGLFTNMTATEHFNYLKNEFPKFSWGITLVLLGNAAVFNSLLYRGHFPKKNIAQSNFKFYHQAFQRIFEQGPARRNFFLQIVFFGKIIFSEGNPVECDPVVFNLAKKGLKKSKINYICGNIVEAAAKSSIPIDVVSLSDVPSYFSGTTEKQFMQEIRKGLAPGGLVIVRNYLRIPEQTDLTGFSRITSQFYEQIRNEKVQMYDVAIFKEKMTNELY